MAKIEIKKVEERLNHRLLFSVRVSGYTEPVEFPVDIPDQGSQAANEAAVLTSVLAVAENIEAAAQLRMGAVGLRSAMSARRDDPIHPLGGGPTAGGRAIHDVGAPVE